MAKACSVGWIFSVQSNILFAWNFVCQRMAVSYENVFDKSGSPKDENSESKL